MQTAKQFGKPVVRYIMGALPVQIGLAIVQRVPRLSHFMAPGKKILFDKYLGHLKVNIDTTYPIERAMLGNNYEPELIYIIRTFVQKGNYCLDIGANIGAITLALADTTGQTGKVYAFEPGPVLFERLERNLALNPEVASIVSPHMLGAADKPGVLYWNEDPNNRGNAGLLDTQGTEVAVTTIDTFFAAGVPPRLDFVKIDVEGMELEVLKGGLATWQKYKPLIYFETLREFEQLRGMSIFKEIEAMLNEIDYALYSLNERQQLTPITSEQLTSNTLAIPNTHPRRS